MLSISKLSDFSVALVGCFVLMLVVFAALGGLPGSATVWVLGISAASLWALQGTQYMVEKWSDNIELGIHVRKLHVALYFLAPLLVAFSFVAESGVIT